MPQKHQPEFASVILKNPFYITLVFIIGFTPTVILSDSAGDFLVEGQPNFDELFFNAVHSREVCEIDYKPCRVPLQKRVEDYYLLIGGKTAFLSEDIAEVAQKSINRVISDLFETTGLRPILSKPKKASNFVYLVFFNEEEYETDPENFILARIAPSSLLYPEKRRAAFHWFRTSHLKCMYITTPYPDGIIRDVQIWVKVDVTAQQVSECIAEEFFNSFGLDDTDEYESIFDWPNVKDARRSEGNLRPLTELHLSFLRKLYDPQMKPNQSEQETKELLLK